MCYETAKQNLREFVQQQEMDLDTALSLLSDFVEFARQQERAEAIDGVCDPELSVKAAMRLLQKYNIGEDDSDRYALSA